MDSRRKVSQVFIICFDSPSGPRLRLWYSSVTFSQTHHTR